MQTNLPEILVPKRSNRKTTVQRKNSIGDLNEISSTMDRFKERVKHKRSSGSFLHGVVQNLFHSNQPVHEYPSSPLKPSSQPTSPIPKDDYCDDVFDISHITRQLMTQEDGEFDKQGVVSDENILISLFIGIGQKKEIF